MDGRGAEDFRGQAQELGGGLGGRTRSRRGGHGQGLGRLDVETEKGLRDFNGRVVAMRLAPDHLAFGLAAHAMGIDGQKAAGKLLARPADSSEGDLKGFTLSHRVGGQKVVNRLIGGDERKAVGDLHSPLAEGAALADPGDAQGGLVNQLQGQARLNLFGRFSTPAAQEVPGSQAQMLGNQQPQTHQRSRHFIGQKLAHAAFETGGIARLAAAVQDGALGLKGDQRGRRIGRRRVEFFFEGRNFR